ncbi:MAG TPA: PA domain-containing protein, partial [Anaerolineales bacterium]
TLSGPTYFVGLGCNTSPPLPAPSTDAIAVIERGVCSFTEKVTNAQNAGYAAGIVFNNAAPGNCEAIVNMAAAGNIPFLFVSRSHGFAILGITGYNRDNCPTGANPPLPPPGTAGSTVNLSAVFDGWGYIHLFDANTLQEIDTYAVTEALDPNFATGFGNLTVHEVAVDIETDLAYLSYYDAGLRVITFGASGIQEVGHYIHEDGNDFWGVQVFRLPADETEQTYVAASDRDSGLWIFKYAGP